MPERENPDWAEGITKIVQDPIRFKIKLDIGEDVYTSLRMKKYLLDAIDAGGGAITGMSVATSTTVASTFFVPSGFLGAIGIGVAATPVGWAVTAGIIGAGLSFALGRNFVRGGSSRVRTVPDFINTPLDILALGLFDSIAMLSVKVATIDGEFADSERNLIKQYFSTEWGYDLAFIEVGLSEIEKASIDYSIKQIALKLAEFKKKNPDCNYSSMSKEIIRFLTEISEADGILDEREEMAVERVKRIFDEVGAFSLADTTKEGLSAVSDGSRRGIEAIGSGVAGVVGSIKSAGGDVASKLKKRP